MKSLIRFCRFAAVLLEDPIDEMDRTDEITGRVVATASGRWYGQRFR